MPKPAARRRAPSDATKARKKTPAHARVKSTAAPKAVAPAKTNRVAVSSPKAQVEAALAWLAQEGSPRIVEEMGPRYGIHTKKAFGVSVGSLRQYAKRLGSSHELAAALWASPWYEARMLAVFVEEPARVTPAQMDSWCRDFDNWALCDTACFHLFDRTPHAAAKVVAWAKRREEFAKRAAFALLASMALHGRGPDDAFFARVLELIDAAAVDERNFVKKAVSWALRAIGRRSSELNSKAVALARGLAASPVPAARWVGKDALRELTSPAVLKRLSKAKSVARPRK